MLLITTLVSIAVAAALGVLAWQLAQAERRRSEARVAALVASLNANDGPLGLDLAPDDELSTPLGEPPLDPDVRSAPHDAMFASTIERESPASGRCVAVGVVAAILVAMIGLAWTVVHVLTPVPQTTDAAPTSPLELLSLTSARRGQELVVSGVVRNPRGATTMDEIGAAVLFFDERGGFLMSGRAPLDFQVLAPGEQSPFQLTVVAPESTARYRVSFRRASGAILSHVNRRSSTLASPTVSAQANVAARTSDGGR